MRLEDPHGVAAPEDGGEVPWYLHVLHQDRQIALSPVEHRADPVVAAGSGHGAACWRDSAQQRQKASLLEVDRGKAAVTP